MKTTILLITCLFAGLAQAEVLIGFDFADYGGGEESGTSTVFQADMISPAYITRGSGISAANNAGRFNANNWAEPDVATAIANDDYFEWTVAAQAGYQFTVTNIGFNFQRSSTGPADFSLRSSADGYAADLDTFVGLANGSTEEADITDLADRSSVTFRFYGYGNTSTAGSAGFEGSGLDLRIEGVIAAIPEPATLGLVAIGLACAMGVRRRR